MRASVIDLGYNSLKMVCYEVSQGGAFRAFDQRGSLTKIGEGLSDTGFLGEERIAKTIRQLKLFNEVNRMDKIDEVLPVATSPVREAINGDEFLRTARAETGLRFRVLTSREEALFAYVGAAIALKIPDMLIFDLGGGSLDLTLARNFRVRRTLSLPLGALRLNEEFGKHGGGFEKKDYERMRGLIEEVLPDRRELGLDSSVALVGVGGTMRALARHDQRLRDYPLNKVHNYALSRKSIVSIHKRLRFMDAKEVSRIPHFGKDRAESITSGSLVVALLMDKLRTEKVIVSTHGLRDGVLAEYLRRTASRGKTDHIEAEAGDDFSGWFGQGPWTPTFARSITSIGVFTAAERRILNEAAESFFDIYLSTRAENLFYSVLNEDCYLDHADQLALALAMVQTKAPKIADWFYSRYYSMLRDESKGSVELLAAFIRLLSVLRQTNSSTTARLRGRRLRIEIASPQRDFPELLLDQAVKDVEEATELKVIAVVVRKALGPQVPEVVRQ